MGGMAPIPMMTMVQYGHHLGLSDNERDLMCRLVRTIDLIYIGEVNRRSNNK